MFAGPLYSVLCAGLSAPQQQQQQQLVLLRQQYFATMSITYKLCRGNVCTLDVDHLDFEHVFSQWLRQHASTPVSLPPTASIAEVRVVLAPSMFALGQYLRQAGTVVGRSAAKAQGLLRGLSIMDDEGKPLVARFADMKTFEKVFQAPILVADTTLYDVILGLGSFVAVMRLWQKGLAPSNTDSSGSGGGGGDSSTSSSSAAALWQPLYSELFLELDALRSKGFVLRLVTECQQMISNLREQTLDDGGSGIDFGSPLLHKLLVEDRLGGVGEQLQMIGSALCAQVPVPLCCNNPDCNDMAGVSELQLAGGKGCVCGRAGLRGKWMCLRRKVHVLAY